MSAVLKDAPRLVQMREPDLADVMPIEGAVYSHPWTRGNFVDSLRAGYQCWTWRLGGELLGYFVLLVAAGEGHLLNLTVAAVRQRTGHGSALLKEAMQMARGRGAQHVFLEVRPAIWAPRRCIAASASARSQCGPAIIRRTTVARTHWY